jgi:hypothetical protein
MQLWRQRVKRVFNVRWSKQHLFDGGGSESSLCLVELHDVAGHGRSNDDTVALSPYGQQPMCTTEFTAKQLNQRGVYASRVQVQEWNSRHDRHQLHEFLLIDTLVYEYGRKGPFR